MSPHPSPRTTIVRAPSKLRMTVSPGQSQLDPHTTERTPLLLAHHSPDIHSQHTNNHLQPDASITRQRRHARDDDPSPSRADEPAPTPSTGTGTGSLAARPHDEGPILRAMRMGGRWQEGTVLGWKPVLLLENRASVARDHLANERTYLAWLRTSLSLTSIGVAITQLFRLTSALYSLPTAPTPSSTTTSTPAAVTFPPALPTGLGSTEDVLASLYAQVQSQNVLLESLGTKVARDRRRYEQIGKPVGVGFVVLGLAFLTLGTYRYFRVQHLLQTGSFPSSRRAIVFATFCVGSLCVAAFVTIVALKGT